MPVRDVPPLAEPFDPRDHLRAALERQTSLREAADRALARARDDREDAYERLLVRCRALEGEKASWIEGRDALARRAAEAERALLERIGDLESRLAEVEREAARSKRALIDERDRITAGRLASEAREEDLSLRLLAAEERFGVDVARLSAVVALRTKEAEAALIEAASERADREAAQRQFAALTASTSWKLGRPLRVSARLLRRALRWASGRSR